MEGSYKRDHKMRYDQDLVSVFPKHPSADSYYASWEVNCSQGPEVSDPSILM